MKFLKIENSKGFFFKSREEVNNWVEIDKITKEDLFDLLDKAISSEFEMDEYQESDISHKAHQIVYKSIFEKFSTLISNKSKFKDECDSQYKSALEKYKTIDDKHLPIENTESNIGNQ